MESFPNTPTTKKNILQDYHKGILHEFQKGIPLGATFWNTEGISFRYSEFPLTIPAEFYHRIPTKFTYGIQRKSPKI